MVSWVSMTFRKGSSLVKCDAHRTSVRTISNLYIRLLLGRRFLTALLVFAMGYLRNRMRSLRTRQAAADVYSSLRRDHFMVVLRKKIRRIVESDLLLRNPWNVCLGWDRSGCKGRAGVAWDANWWTEIIQTPTWMVGADPCSSTGDPVPWWLTLCLLNISSCPLYLCHRYQPT